MIKNSLIETIRNVDVMDMKILKSSLNSKVGMLELSKKINIAHKNLLFHVLKLEKAGLIIRIKNKQKVLIFLTERGNKLYYDLKDIFVFNN